MKDGTCVFLPPDHKIPPAAASAAAHPTRYVAPPLCSSTASGGCATSPLRPTDRLTSRTPSVITAITWCVLARAARKLSPSKLAQHRAVRGEQDGVSTRAALLGGTAPASPPRGGGGGLPTCSPAARRRRAGRGPRLRARPAAVPRSSRVASKCCWSPRRGGRSTASYTPLGGRWR